MWTVWTGTGTDCFGLKLAHAEAIESHYTSVQSTSSYTNNAYTSYVLETNEMVLKSNFQTREETDPRWHSFCDWS